MKDFYTLLQEITKLSTWALPTAGISPVVAVLAGMGPTWPTSSTIVASTGLVVLFVLIQAYSTLRRSNSKRVRGFLKLWLAATIASAIIYFSLSALLIYEIPTSGDRLTRGLHCSTAATLLYQENCPWLNIDEMQSAEYEPTRLWTPASVAISKMLLLSSWFSMFAAGGAFLGSFVTSEMFTAKRSRGTGDA